jgi:hypothetical protein
MAVAVLTTAAGTFASGRGWGNHAFPFTFLMGNHIDSHQETRLMNDGSLRGFFYVYWTGEKTAEGEPIAHHCTEPAHYAQGCFAAWHLRAEPCIEEVNGCTAMFLYHHHDHPVWLVGPHTMNGALRGTRSMIPQPGSYTHMHWITEGVEHMGMTFPSSLADIENLFGVDIEVPEECNVAMAGELTPGSICPGYFLELTAVKRFVFRHGGELMRVEPGVDNRTHLNLLTSFPMEMPMGTHEH